MTTDTRPDIPLGCTYDTHGKELTFKDRSGYWHERTRDPHGRELTYKDRTGFWCERTRDTTATS